VTTKVNTTKYDVPMICNIKKHLRNIKHNIKKLKNTENVLVIATSTGWLKKVSC